MDRETLKAFIEVHELGIKTNERLDAVAEALGVALATVKSLHAAVEVLMDAAPPKVRALAESAMAATQTSNEPRSPSIRPPRPEDDPRWRDRRP